MYTCCPKCRTCFRIKKAQLAVAQGKARCGQCAHIFNAKRYLNQEPPAPKPRAKTPAAEKLNNIKDVDVDLSIENDIDTLIDKIDQQLTLAIDELESDTTRVEADPGLFDEQIVTNTDAALEVENKEPPPPSATTNDQPDNGQAYTITRDNETAHPSEEDIIPLRLRDSLQIQPPKKRGLALTLLSILFVFILISLFAAQFVLFRNMELATRFPEIQPWLIKFCDPLPCRYSGRQDIDQIQLLNRDVRAHPQIKNALLITATLVNKAPFGQPYPNIQISLFDLTGNIVAQRRFKPVHYMGELSNPFVLMNADTPVQIALEVKDPSKDAVNFEFEFL